MALGAQPGFASGAWATNSWIAEAWGEFGAIIADINVHIFNIRQTGRR